MPSNQSDSVAFNLVRPEYANNSIARALANDIITQRDAELIRAFCAELETTNDIKIPRVNKITFTLVTLRRFVGEYDKNTYKEVYDAVSIIKKAKTDRNKQYKQNTIVDFIKILKQFYKWAITNEFSTIPIVKINEIKNPEKDEMTKTAADLLTRDEVSTFMKACRNDRDLAFFMALYESGCRVGELGTLSWAQVKMDEYGAVVNVNAKTKKPRYIRLIMSVEYLAKWRSVYPGNASGDSLVFLNKNGDPMTHAQISRQIMRISNRAGIKKNITPHLFRHSRITHLIQEGMAESVVKKIMWGSADSRMFRCYLHLTGNDVDDEVFRLYGIKSPKKVREHNMVPRQCSNCRTINAPISNYCCCCGWSLSPDAQSEQELLNRVWTDKPEITAQWAKERIADKQRQLA